MYFQGKMPIMKLDLGPSQAEIHPEKDAVLPRAAPAQVPGHERLLSRQDGAR